jgi:F-type H+-transporting ATPase subunit a
MTGTGTLLAAANIEVGHHRTADILGLSVNIDTVWSSLVAGVIVLGAGLYMARRATSGRPSKLQLAFETIVDAIQKQVASSMGPVAPFVVPLALTLFMFILIANWLELIPSGGYLEAPSADINFTLALALIVIIWMHITAIRKKGLGSYLRHYAQPYPALIPLEVIGELVKPFTLALRLFGNIFAGGVMLAIIGLIPSWLLWLPNGLWKGFDLIIGAIQAFIFALLTILYFGFALEEEEH